MHEDFMGWLEQQRGRQYELHRQHVNPVFVKMLRAIGFDKGYVRGQGPYLWDAEGNKYLDLLTGWGVFALVPMLAEVFTTTSCAFVKRCAQSVRLDGHQRRFLPPSGELSK